MNKIILIRAVLIISGLFLIFYPGLYLCGWGGINDLLDYAACNWDCVERSEIAWALFRVFLLLEILVLLGISLIIYGVDKTKFAKFRD